jgi:hypothetical protein
VTENRKELQFELDTDFAKFTQEQVRDLLPYLQSFAETGTLEPQTPLQGGLSQLAQEMLDIIGGNPPYIAGWNICGALNVGQYELNSYLPGTKYDKALKELIDAGIVEELPDLACRYRLTEKYKNAQSPLQGENDTGDLQEMILKQSKELSYFMGTCNQQVKHIANLEQLVEEWCILHRDTVANPSNQHVWEERYSILQEKTSQLLEEE